MAPASSAPTPIKSPGTRHDLLFLLGILCLGFVVRIYHLGLLSLWRDEIFTRYYSETSLSYLWTTGFRQETNPPLYYTIMHFWIPLFGPGEVALRSFSVIVSSATLLVIYALGKELGGRSLGLIGALLMAVLPSEIWFAQEARTYALLQLELSVALLGAARFLSRKSIGDFALYAVEAIAAIYSHTTAIVIIAALNLAMIGSILWDRNEDTASRLIRWLSANAIVALATLPLLIAALYMSKSNNLQWIPGFTPFGFLRLAADVMGGPAADREFLQGRTLSYLLLFCTVFVLIYFRKLDRRNVTILALAPLFYIALALLINIYRPILAPRTLVWILIPLSLLFAHALLQSGRLRPVMLTLLAAVLVIGLDAQFFPSFSPKENWRELIAKNQDMLSKADIIVLGSSAPVTCINYYGPDHLPPMVYWHPDEKEHPLTFSHTFFYEKNSIPRVETARVLDWIKSGKRVCLVLGGAPQIMLTKSGLLPKPDYLFADEFLTEYDMSVMAWN